MGDGFGDDFATGGNARATTEPEVTLAAATKAPD